MSLEDTKNIYDETGEQFSPVIGIDAIRTADGTSLLDLIHPVGEYYETSNTSFDPNVSWGGTWEKDNSGCVLVSQDNGTFSSLGSKVGNLQATISAHTHTVPAHNHGGSTGGTALTTAMLPGHTHSFSATTSSNSHTHSVSITTSSDSHTHNVGMDFDGAGGSSRWTFHQNGTSGAGDTVKTSSDSHTHTVKGNTGSTSHTHTVSGTSGSTGSGSMHSHTISQQEQANTGSSGSATIDIIQPSIVCIRWHRTA